MEDIIYQGRTSLANYAVLLGLAIILILINTMLFFVTETRGIAIVGLLFGIIIIGFSYLNVFATNYMVTTERVIKKKVLFSQYVSEVEIPDIRNIQVYQGIIQRMSNIGNVGISTAGQSGVEIIFAGIKNPQSIANLIRKQRKQD